MASRVPSLPAAALITIATVLPCFAQTIPVSVATDGTAANNSSELPAMSATGRFVAFVSWATNLVPGDTNGVEDVFLRDRDTDADGVFDEPGAVATVRVSQQGPIEGNGPSSEPAITADGRFVVFTSFAANLFAPAQPPLPVSAILRWDRLTGHIVLVSRTTSGDPLLQVRSVGPDVSDDGNRVVFTYGGSIPAEVAAGHRGVIFRRDIAAGTLTQVSTVPLVEGSDRAEFNAFPSISGDGATIAYSVATRMTTGIPFTLGGTVYVVDAATNVIRSSYPGVQPRLSRDGAVLAFIGLFPGSGAGQLARIHLATGERRGTGGVATGSEDGSVSPSGRYFSASGQVADFQYGSTMFVSVRGRVAFDAAETAMALAQLGASLIHHQVVVASLTTLFDRDGDGLNDHWEEALGLSPVSADGANGAAGDPDQDGLTNAEEFARGSHPLGTQARFLAEGSAGSFFTTRVAIANPTDTRANVAVRFELAGGGTVKRSIWIAPRSRVSFDSGVEGITGSFSTVVESQVPVAVDRLMTWGAPGAVPYGSHAETSSPAPGTSWILAEGSTILGFQLFYLLHNPQATPTTATVRYLLPSGPPLVRTYDLPARSRTTIYVNTIPELAATDVSAEITATQPIAVERAMYRSSASQAFALGHAAAAVVAPATAWAFGEGSTGAFFDTYLLLANPSAAPATVDVQYLRDAGGPVNRTYVVPANGRFSIYVDGEPGLEASSFGIRVSSAVPIVAERAMYWAGGFFDYYEGHASAGATQTGSHWVLAEGEELGPYAARTFVLIANTGPAPATVVVRSLPDGIFLPTVSSGPLQIAGNARLTLPMSALPGFTRGGIEVVEQGTPTNALIVEGAIYWNAAGQVFGAGANWPATRFP